MKDRTHHRDRQGYTLIELLTVIAIITILMSLAVGSYGNIRQRALTLRTRADISQLSTAIQAFLSEMNVQYIPQRFTLKSAYNPGEPDGVYLKKIFPRINLNETNLPNLPLDNNQTLVFFLTGGKITNYTGFSKNPTNPFVEVSNPDEERIGPFITYTYTRFDEEGRLLDHYGTPYAYFAATSARQYENIPFINPLNPLNMVLPYRNDNNPLLYYNNSSFQIISAGQDMMFGPGERWTPGVGPWSGKNPGTDDISNFANARLGDPQ